MNRPTLDLIQNAYILPDGTSIPVEIVYRVAMRLAIDKGYPTPFQPDLSNPDEELRIASLEQLWENYVMLINQPNL